MPSYTKDLLVKPDSFTVSSGETVSVSPTSSGFEYLMFRVRKLLSGEKLSGETDECELGIVVLGGRCSVESTAGSWFNFGGRAHVFAGMPTALGWGDATASASGNKASCCTPGSGQVSSSRTSGAWSAIERSSGVSGVRSIGEITRRPAVRPFSYTPAATPHPSRPPGG